MSNICINKKIDCKVDISKYNNADDEQQKQICTSHDGEFYKSRDTDKKGVPFSRVYEDYPMCIGEASPFAQNQTDKNKEYYEDKLMYEAISNNRINDFIKLLEKNPNRKMSEQLKYGYHGNTIFHEAIYHNSEAILGLLLTPGNICKESLKKKNKDGNTILHLATLKQLHNVVDRLLKNYICNNRQILMMKNLKGDTPFLSSIRTGSEYMVDLYLDKMHLHEFSDVRNSVNKYNCLHVAVITPNKNLNIIKRLVKMGIDMVDKTIKEHYYYDVDGKSQSMQIPQDDKDKPDKSILQDLKNQPKTPLNLEIETYIIREFYKYHTNNLGGTDSYNIQLKLNSEYAPFETDSCDTISVPVSYSEDYNENQLFIDQDVEKYKILPYPYKKYFKK